MFKSDPALRILVQQLHLVELDNLALRNRQSVSGVTIGEVRQHLNQVQEILGRVPSENPAAALYAQHRNEIQKLDGPDFLYVENDSALAIVILILRAVRVELEKDLGPIDVPSPIDYFLSYGLYRDVLIPSDEARHVVAIEYFDGVLDVHCHGCARESMFRADVVLPTAANTSGRLIVQSTWELVREFASAVFTTGNQQREMTLAEYGRMDRRFVNQFFCVRDPKHRLIFYSQVQGRTLQKIGQFPSHADMVGPDLNQYRKILGDRFVDLRRAIGLAAHDVGVAAFIYLRRVFEGLIRDAAAIASAEENWVSEAFEAARMDEKILMLRDHLPDFLVQNRQTYGILSKGVHELTEQECMKHFAVVKTAIELILDEEMARRESEKKRKEARDAIAAAAKSLKST